jgi:hypothetical protein
MAKYTTTAAGSRDELAAFIKTYSQTMGTTVSVEDEIFGRADSVKYWVGTFERYAFMGNGRSSLTVILLEHGGSVDVIATASGGSGAMFFKVNTWSEQSFLDDFIALMDRYNKDL